MDVHFYRACALFLFAPCICTVYFKRLTDKTIYPATDNPQRISTAMDIQQLKIDSNGLTASIKLFCDFYILCLMRLPLLVIMCTALDNIQFIIFHIKDNKEF